MAVAAAVLAACGDDPTIEGAGGQGATTTTSTTVPHDATVSGQLTTADGHRYQVTLTVSAATATGGDDCPGTATPGKVFVPVTLTVANLAADRPAPFPPLRLELTGGPGTRPGQVMVKEPAGACTFAPKVASVAPGGSVVFRGTSPAIDAGAPRGGVGRLEVKVSESSFTLGTPVPLS